MRHFLLFWLFYILYHLFWDVPSLTGSRVAARVVAIRPVAPIFVAGGMMRSLFPSADLLLLGDAATECTSVSFICRARGPPVWAYFVHHQITTHKERRHAH